MQIPMVWIGFCNVCMESNGPLALDIDIVLFRINSFYMGILSTYSFANPTSSRFDYFVISDNNKKYFIQISCSVLNKKLI